MNHKVIVKLVTMRGKMQKWVSLIFIICGIATLRRLNLSEEEITYRTREISNAGNLEPPLHSKTWLKILIYTPFFNSQDVWKDIFQRLRTGQCEETRCSITFDKKQLKQSDAVLFNAWNLKFGDDLEMLNYLDFPPLYRHQDQIYIFYSMEPPTRLDEAFHSALTDFFNWTMTYRKDSDVYEPFGVVSRQEKKANRTLVTQKELKSKKMGVWLVSYCYKLPPYFRENFIDALKKQISIDILGKCGKNCDSYRGVKIYGSSVFESNCEKQIKNYIFYFAMENSLCEEYITEKIFKAWQLGVIPVVFGGGNYSVFAPPHSYIDYRDFESVSHLATYLKKVASDAKLYNKFFDWRDEGYEIEIGSPYKPFICDLCKKLHSHQTHRRRKTYANAYDWFEKGSKCKKDFSEFPYPFSHSPAVKLPAFV